MVYYLGKDVRGAQIVHFTHNDGDALGCDVILRGMSHYLADSISNIYTYYIPNKDVNETIDNFIDYMEGYFKYERHNGNLEPVKTYKIVISDIEPSMDTLWKLHAFALKYHIKLLGFDHHKTNPAKDTFDWFYQEYDCDSIYACKIPQDIHDSCFKRISPEREESCKGLIQETIDTYMSFVKEGKNFFHTREYEDGPERTSATMMMFRHFMEADLDKHSRHMDVISLPGWITLYNFADAISRYDTWNWMLHPSDMYDYKEDIYTKLLAIYPIHKLTTMILDELIVSFALIRKNGRIDMYGDGSIHYDDPAYILSAYDTIKNLIVTDEMTASLFALDTLYSKSLNNAASKVHVTIDEYNRVVGHVIPDHNLFTSNMCNEFLGLLPNLDYLIMYYPTSCKLSLRTAREDIDVSEIALSMGGGGHAKAAGCALSDRVFYEMLENYYVAPTYKEYYGDI